MKRRKTNSKENETMQPSTNLIIAIVVVVAAIIILMNASSWLGFAASGSVKSLPGSESNPSLSTNPIAPVVNTGVGGEPVPGPVPTTFQCPDVALPDDAGNYSATSELRQSLSAAARTAQSKCFDARKPVVTAQDAEESGKKTVCTTANCKFNSKKIEQSCRIESCTYTAPTGQDQAGNYEATQCTWVAAQQYNVAWGGNAFNISTNGIPDNVIGAAKKCSPITSSTTIPSGWTCTYGGVYNKTTYTCVQ